MFIHDICLHVPRFFVMKNTYLLSFLCLVTISARAASSEKLEALPDLWVASNSRMEKVELDGETVLRWEPQAGKSATLAVNPESALFNRLRYFGRLEFEFRIVQGQFDELEFRAMGHVTGPRQYKVHQWRLGTLTTLPGVWHPRQLELDRPNWMPWDQADGTDPQFLFGVLATMPDTVIELRRLRLSSPTFVVKPFFEYPITWPVRSDGPDGSAVYTMTISVLNTSGRTSTIQAAVASPHERFQVAIEPSSRDLKNGEVGTFEVTSSITKANIAAVPELYSEIVRVAFSSTKAPAAISTFEMPLTRPLAPGLNRQIVISADDLKFLRDKLAAGDESVRKALKVDETIAEADKFSKIDLSHIPTGHLEGPSPAPNPPVRYEAGSFMPEVVNPATGERESGTPAANLFWKQYLGHVGQITEKLGLAYIFTGDEKYAAKAVELMELWAAQYKELPWKNQYEPPWSDGPAQMSSSRIAPNSTYPGNMAMRWHMRMLGLIGDSVSLTPDARRKIYQGFVLPFATETAKFPGGISNMTDIANHNLLVMGLVFDDSNLVRQALLSDPGLISRLRDIDADGFSSESRPMNYHAAAMAEFLPSINYVKNSGLKVDFPGDRLLASLKLPFLRSTLWGAIPNTGDCGRGARASNTALADELAGIFPEQAWLQDCGRDATLAAKIQRLKNGRPPQPEGFKQFLETTPRLFKDAGFAILRAGDTPETQIMATLDFGRNIAHSHLDRNQITLAAFGKTFTHGPGTLYNAGKSSLVLSDDAKLNSFCQPGSLGQNVVLVDSKNQMPAIGKLVAWSDEPANQFATAYVKGIAPGVDHTRTLMLRDGLVVVLDRLESADEHTYDFVYHNFGEMSPGAGWSSAPVNTPLAETANYPNIQDLKRLTGGGPVHLRWDLTNQVSALAKTPPPTTPVNLALWQVPIGNSEIYTGTTGLSNPNTSRVPDATPTLITRTRGKTADFVTVLEPYKEKPSVTGISVDSDILTIQREGKSLSVPLKDFRKSADQ